MSSFVRPRHKFNRQICQDIKVNPGRNQYGIANQKPDNPIYFTLANIRKGIADGAFMRTTINGTSLPNPIAQLKEFASPPRSGGGKNPPGPKMPNDAGNSFVSRQNTNNAQNESVRREARQQLRQQVRGRIAVARQPNVIRRQIQFQPAPPGEAPSGSVLQAAMRRRNVNNPRPRRVRKGLGLTDAESRNFEFSPYKEPKEEPKEEYSDEQKAEIRGFFQKLLDDARGEKKSSTPATAMQGAGPKRKRPSRTRALDYDKKGSPDIGRSYERVQEQQALNDIIE
jgi:hypothetical protein